MGMEIISNVGTVYKEVPREFEKISTEDATHHFENPANSQNIAMTETKAVVDTKASEQKQGYKDEKDLGQKEVDPTLQASQNSLKSNIEKVNNRLRNLKTNCEFSYHEETHTICIKVIDEESKEVIREIPPEKTLDMIVKMWDLMGLFVDTKK